MVLKTWLRAAAATVAFCVVGLTGSASAQASVLSNLFPNTAGVSVSGTVATPATYSRAQLQALPQTTVQAPEAGIFATRTHTFEGVSVLSLVNAAAPVYPAGAKNPILRATVTATGASGKVVTFAAGELDPGFGNHPAILALKRDGSAIASAPQLVVGGDSAPLRSIDRVVSLKIAVQSPAPTAPPSAGALTIRRGTKKVVLSARILAALPSETRQVTFLQGTTPQQHTETGPTLDRVLAVAGIPPFKAASVAAVGADGYVAAVTPAEDWVGGRQLQIALAEDGVPLAQPRLVTAGDVKGGRYVSGTVDIVVEQAPLSWWLLAAPFG